MIYPPPVANPIIPFSKNENAPVYAWQYHFNPQEFEEFEHLDIQFSISKFLFGDWIGRLVYGQILSIELSQKPAQTPVDLAFSNGDNWDFPAKNFKRLKLQFIKKEPYNQNEVFINGENLEIFINLETHSPFLVSWHNRHISPILYISLFSCLITENGETKQANICFWPQDELHRPFYA